MNPIAEIIAEHHDYVWARLPFIVPMALAVARRNDDRTARSLARMMVELRPLVLGHLEREERLLVVPSMGQNVHHRLHAEHVAVTTLLDHIREATGYAEQDHADPTERALYAELARLDEHMAAQIALEEQLMASHSTGSGDQPGFWSTRGVR